MEADLLKHDVVVPPTQDLNGGMQSIFLNSLDYVRRNVRCLLELINMSSISPSTSIFSRTDGFLVSKHVKDTQGMCNLFYPFIPLDSSNHHHHITKTENMMHIK